MGVGVVDLTLNIRQQCSKTGISGWFFQEAGEETEPHCPPQDLSVAAAAASLLWRKDIGASCMSSTLVKGSLPYELYLSQAPWSAGRPVPESLLSVNSCFALYLFTYS